MMQSTDSGTHFYSCYLDCIELLVLVVRLDLDDMIKARREKEGKARKPKAGKPTLAQQSVGRGKAKKSAAANA
eukprot:scaffold49502_cov53-Attheya_sp.AAC.7